MDALNALIEKRPRWGFWKCFGRLRNTGHAWNHKRVYRVYKAMKLNLPRRTKRRLPTRVQQPMVVEARANAEWSMDFMSDTLYHGRRFRTLNIRDEGVREALDIVVDTSIPGGRVARTLDRLVEWRGRPDAIRVDNVLYPESRNRGRERSGGRVFGGKRSARTTSSGDLPR